MNKWWMQSLQKVGHSAPLKRLGVKQSPWHPFLLLT